MEQSTKRGLAIVGIILLVLVAAAMIIPALKRIQMERNNPGQR